MEVEVQVFRSAGSLTLSSPLLRNQESASANTVNRVARSRISVNRSNSSDRQLKRVPTAFRLRSFSSPPSIQGKEKSFASSPLRARERITSRFGFCETKPNRSEHGSRPNEEHHSQIGKGDEEDRLGEVAASPNREIILSRALSPCQLRTAVQPTCSNPENLICKPLPSDDWSKVALAHLEKFAIRKMKIKANSDLDTIVEEFVKTSVSTTNIQTRIREYLTAQPASFSFLIAFLATSDPEQFLQKAKALNKEQHALFLKIIGGEKGLSLLERCLDKKIQQQWKLHLEKVKRVEQACNNKPRALPIPFPPFFDNTHPISNITHEEVTNAFRSFYPGTLTGEVYFTFNDEPKKIPKLTTNPKIEFLSWLIGHCNNTLKIDPELKAEQQASLVVNGTLSKEERDFLTQSVNNPQNEITLDLKDLLEDFNKFKPSVGSNKSEPNELVELFDEYRIKQRVPSYPILQSWTPGAYSYAELYLRMKLCPEFFTAANGCIPKMKSFPTDITHFAIKINPDKKDFEATQIKRYKFFFDRSTDNNFWGRTDTHWTLIGSLANNRKKGSLDFYNLELDKKVDLSARYMVASKLGSFS